MNSYTEYLDNTVATLHSAHAFESAHLQSYVIAHNFTNMSFRGKLSL